MTSRGRCIAGGCAYCHTSGTSCSRSWIPRSKATRPAPTEEEYEKPRGRTPRRRPPSPSLTPPPSLASAGGSATCVRPSSGGPTLAMRGADRQTPQRAYRVNQSKDPAALRVSSFAVFHNKGGFSHAQRFSKCQSVRPRYWISPAPH